MFEAIILGTIQGIAEWLPVSSEGLIFLVKTNFFSNGESIKEITELALWLHLGTFLAALVYFRKDVWRLIKTLFNFKFAEAGKQKILVFLLVATMISGILGIGLLLMIVEMGEWLGYTSRALTLGIGILLLITAGMQFRVRSGGLRQARDLKNSDSVFLGVMQGLAVLPGLSRSGLTISALLLKKFDKEVALKLSFLMSLPIVLGGNIILNLDKFALTLNSFVSLAASFIFGLLTIGLLLRIARKINFAWFVLGFGLLMIVAVLV